MPFMVDGVDHVAIGTGVLDARVDLLTRDLGWRLIRKGVQHSTGNSIVLLRDMRSRFKLELVADHSSEPKLLHVAYRSLDVLAEYNRLLSMGYRAILQPHELPEARAISALLADPTDLKVQLVQYAPDSPDV